MKKVIITCLIFVVMMILATTYVQAADASLNLQTNSTLLKPGDNIEITMSTNNSSVEDGISVLAGALSFDTNVFEPIALNMDEEISKANTIQKNILTELKDGMKNDDGITMTPQLLYIDTNWCIFIIESGEAYAFTALTMTDSISVGETSHKVGSIKFKVKESAPEQKTKIQFSMLCASSVSQSNAEGEDNKIKPNMEDVATENITISRTSSDGFQDIRDVGSGSGSGTVTGGSTTGSGSTTGTSGSSGTGSTGTSSTGTSSTAGASKTNTQAQSDAPYTGVEDVIPFIAVFAIIGFFGYMKYRKYQGI